MLLVRYDVADVGVQQYKHLNKALIFPSAVTVQFKCIGIVTLRSLVVFDQFYSGMTFSSIYRRL